MAQRDIDKITVRCKDCKPGNKADEATRKRGGTAENHTSRLKSEFIGSLL